MKDVIVIGSGISGLLSAYECVLKSLSVKVVCKEDRPATNGLDMLNLFLNTRQGIACEVLKFARGDGGFGFKNFADKAFLSWLLKFGLNQSKTSKKLEILTSRYAFKSYEIYENLSEKIGDFEFKKSGSSIVFSDKERYKNMLESIKFNDENFEILKSDDTRLKVLKTGVQGGLHLKQNAMLNAQKLYENLKQFLINSGVEFVNDEIIDYKISDSKVAYAMSKHQKYEANYFIQASGDDVSLAKNLGVNFDLVSGKIYEIKFEANLAEAANNWVFIDDLSVSIKANSQGIIINTKPQINAKDKQINMQEINEALNKLRAYCGNFELKNPTFAVKNLAFTPNSLPIFGRDEICKNLFYISGFGLNETLLAPSIAKIVAGMLCEGLGNENSDDVLLFSGLIS